MTVRTPIDIFSPRCLFRVSLDGLSVNMVNITSSYEWPAPVWLDSSVGRALHRYRRGHGFESRSGLIFFQALISQLLKLCV